MNPAAQDLPPFPSLRESISARRKEVIDDWTEGFGAGIAAALEEIDRIEAEIAERTKEALGRVRAEGKKTGGEIPYGFRVGRDGRTLHELATEQKVIRRVRRLRDGGMSLREIASLLHEDGIVSRAGRRFHASQIRNMLLDRE